MSWVWAQLGHNLTRQSCPRSRASAVPERSRSVRGGALEREDVKDTGEVLSGLEKARMDFVSAGGEQGLGRVVGVRRRRPAAHDQLQLGESCPKPLHEVARGEAHTASVHRSTERTVVRATTECSKGDDVFSG